MSAVTNPTNVPSELPDAKSLDERLEEEHAKWLKAKRSGNWSAQMRDARIRMDRLLDEKLLLRLEDMTII